MAPSMVLSVDMPHGEYDEEDCTAELKLAKIIMEARKKMGSSPSCKAAEGRQP